MGSRVELYGHDTEHPTPQPELFSLYEEEPGGTRPDRIATLSGPQEWAQLRTVQQIVDPVPLLPTLDDPAPQMVGQLVEVPTIVSWSLLQLIMKQNVDIPVPGRGGRISGLQRFHPGQRSTALPSQQRISERIVEQIVDIPGGGLQDFRPGQSSFSSSHVPARAYDAVDAPGDVFFSHFSPNL